MDGKIVRGLMRTLLIVQGSDLDFFLSNSSNEFHPHDLQQEFELYNSAAKSTRSSSSLKILN